MGDSGEIGFDFDIFDQFFHDPLEDVSVSGAIQCAGLVTPSSTPDLFLFNDVASMPTPEPRRQSQSSFPNSEGRGPEHALYAPVPRSSNLAGPSVVIDDFYNFTDNQQASGRRDELQSQLLSLYHWTHRQQRILKDVDSGLAELAQVFSFRFKRSVGIVNPATTLEALERIVTHGDKNSASEAASTLYEPVRDFWRSIKINTRWTPRERSKLLEGVMAENERMLLEKLRASGLAADAAFDVLEATRASNPSAFVASVTGIDWDAVSKDYVATRSATDCLLQWTVNDHPLINHAVPTEDELRSLKQLKQSVLPAAPGRSRAKLAKTDGTTSKSHSVSYCSPWQQIAAQLGSNRTAFCAFAWYQRKLNPDLHKGKWSAEEDDRLRRAVAKFGLSRWTTVSRCLEGRTGQQCLHRWEKAIDPKIKRGRWSAEEDEMLRRAVEANGGSGNWSRIKGKVPGRTDVQCRERWVNVLDPSIVAVPFSPAEDDRLCALVDELGEGKWALIASKLAMGRTDNQLWRRWKYIKSRAKAGRGRKAR